MRAFTAAAHSEVGRTPNGENWSRNDDHYLMDQQRGLFMVLDGGGNWRGPGDRAKRGAEVLHQSLCNAHRDASPRAVIEDAIRDASEVLQSELDDEGCSGGAGVLLAICRGEQIHLAWLGVQIASLVSGQKVEQLTWQHTVRNLAIRNGTLTQEVDQLNGQRFANLWCYSLGSAGLPDPLEVISFTPKPGDRLILTTDGVHRELLGSDFVSACQTHPDPQACANRLVELARERGSRDNATCVVIAFG